jgi:hypothetical protein
MVSEKNFTNSMSLLGSLGLIIARSYKTPNLTSQFHIPFIFMQLTPLEPANNTMPSKNSFKQHIERVRSSLKTFNVIRVLDASCPLKWPWTSSLHLDTSSASMQLYAPLFTSHALFLEVPPLVFQALDNFFTKNPTFKKPAHFKQIIGMNTRATREIAMRAAAAKRGTFILFSLYHFFSYLSSFLLSSCSQCCQFASGEA